VFLAPALVVLGALVVYPVIATVWRSFFDQAGTEFIGIDNYRRIFELDRMRKAIVNSLIWVAVFPIAVTAIGLVLAVLAEKINWRTAFRLILFIPAAIAVMSSGIIWRIMYEADPSRGVVNAALNIPASIFTPEGALSGAGPSYEAVTENPDGSISFSVSVNADGGVAAIGLVRFTDAALPEDAVQARLPAAAPGTLVGVVWRDTVPGDNERGVIDTGERGVPDITVLVVSSTGETVEKVRTGVDGTFEVTGLDPGTYGATIPASTFRQSWSGITWLGADLVTLAAIVAGIWVWGGFSLLVISSGLASLPRETLEAARVDGASEWQVFRRVTVPLLGPVLGVVFVALTINALKMFDLIVGIAPGSVQDDANVVALEMWRTSFTGLGQRGLGSAIAVLLFLMIVPVLVLNVRRFRLEANN
jgi:alpha-glucoside transport system permease protein